MLNVNKININDTFASNRVYGRPVYSFGNNAEARQAYFEMNRDVYCDYVDGDISLGRRFLDGIVSLCRVLTAQDPRRAMKTKIMEQNLLEQAKREYDMVA